MNDLPKQFRDAVSAHLARTDVSATRLGARVLNDPSFVSRLMRGRMSTLATVDRVLMHMGLVPLGPVFRAEVDSFLRETGMKEYLFGMDAVSEPSFVPRLRKGTAPRLDTVQRVREWMAVNGPPLGWEPAGMQDAFRPFRADGPILRADSRSGGENHNGANNGGKHKNERENRGGKPSMKDRQQYPCPQQQNPHAKFLDTREAADFLGLSNRTLDRYRVTGEGPVFHKFGSRIRYALADLQAWAAARRARSTSEADLGEWRTA